MKNSTSAIALSITNMMLRMFLQGLIPVYPFILGKLNGTSSDVGVFLSLSYVFMLSGTYLAGVIMPKYFYPKTILLGSVLPIVLLLSTYGVITHLWLFDICGCALSFFLGLHICANNIMMGYYSSEGSISKNFSILSTSSLLATVLGGFVVGPILLWLGYTQSFFAFAIILLLFFLLLIPIYKPQIHLAKSNKTSFKIDKKLWTLLCCIFLVSILLYGFKMSISIMLKRRGWNVGNISVLMALGTAVTLPLILWWGKISNYANAMLLLLITILCGFAAYARLLGIGIYAIGLIGFACISVVGYAIMIPVMSILFGWYGHQHLPKAQSLCFSAVWLSAIVGFLGNGYALEHFSETTCLLGGLTIAIMALLPLLLTKINNSNLPIASSTDSVAADVANTI